jgi:hypothetical protein
MNNSKAYLGFDPGKSGASALINGNEITIDCFPFVGEEYDIREMYRRLLEIKLQCEDLHISIEDVHKLPSPMNSGDWELSASKHILITLATVCEIPYTLVKAKEWQKEMFQGIKEVRKPNKTITNKKGEVVVKQGALLTKEMSKLAALRLFPKIDLRDPKRKTDRAKSIHDGACDALLIAEYSKRNNL